MTEHAYPEIKIIDFGLARQIKDGEQICLIVGTPEYVGKCCICILSHTIYLTAFIIMVYAHYLFHSDFAIYRSHIFQ